MSDAIYACLLGSGDSAYDIIRMRQFTPERANVSALLVEYLKEHTVCRYDKFRVRPPAVPFSYNMTYLYVRRVIIDTIMYISGQR